MFATAPGVALSLGCENDKGFVIAHSENQLILDIQESSDNMRKSQVMPMLSEEWEEDY